MVSDLIKSLRQSHIKQTVPVVGVISPPGWADPTAKELADLLTQPILTQQSIVAAPELEFDDLENVAALEDEVALCARMLGLAGADVVAMSGTPFVWAGLKSEMEVRARLAKFSEAAGCPMVMAGSAIIDALRALGAQKVALAAPYYTTSWKAHAALMFDAFGFDVLTLQAADDAGQTQAITSLDEHERSSDPEVFIGTVRQVHAAAPAADAIALLGAGVRTLSQLKAFEEELQKPFVSADTALYWQICKTLDLTLKDNRLGALGGLLASATC